MTGGRLRAAVAWARLPDLCLLLLRVTGWLSVTLLASAGCLVLLFAMLGGFTADGFFAHLDNLASRFAAADAERRGQFLSLVRVALVVLILAVAASRWRSLARCLILSEEPRHA